MVMVSMGTWSRLQWCDGGNVGENFVVVIVVVALEGVTVVTSAMVMVVIMATPKIVWCGWQ